MDVMGIIGTHQRLSSLSSVKTIVLANNEAGVYIQAIGQNVRMTLDGTAPVASGNDIGFQITPAMGPILVTAFPGAVLSFIQETATAVVQYQRVSLSRQ